MQFLYTMHFCSLSFFVLEPTEHLEHWRQHIWSATRKMAPLSWTKMFTYWIGRWYHQSSTSSTLRQEWQVYSFTGEIQVPPWDRSDRCSNQQPSRWWQGCSWSVYSSTEEILTPGVNVTTISVRTVNCLRFLHKIIRKSSKYVELKCLEFWIGKYANKFNKTINDHLNILNDMHQQVSVKW